MYNSFGGKKKENRLREVESFCRSKSWKYSGGHRWYQTRSLFKGNEKPKWQLNNPADRRLNSNTLHIPKDATVGQNAF